MEIWIARGYSGFLGLYMKKPKWKYEKQGLYKDWLEGDFIGFLESKKFPEVTFENSPKRVKIELI